jgi:transposase-like protein
MNTYKPRRFSLDNIAFAVGLYYCFNLSRRDIEDLLAESDISPVSVVLQFGVRVCCLLQ